MLKQAKIIFNDANYNYTTSVNGQLTDKEIIKYFKHKWFNLGTEKDNMQLCIEVKIC